MPELSGGRCFVNPIIHNEATIKSPWFTSCRLFTTLVVDGETINDWGSHCENNRALFNKFVKSN